MLNWVRPSAHPTGGVSAEAEHVIVTGSHIPTADEVGPNPLQEVDCDGIEKIRRTDSGRPAPEFTHRRTAACSNAQRVRVRANFSDKFGQ